MHRGLLQKEEAKKLTYEFVLLVFSKYYECKQSLNVVVLFVVKTYFRCSVSSLTELNTNKR